MISIFELFSIGIGPSSSHTVGPMRAARDFLVNLESLDAVARVETTLYGSLAFTGHGHGTDKAIFLGLLGERPEAVDPSAVADIIHHIVQSQSLKLLGKHEIHYAPSTDLIFNQDEILSYHSNGMRFIAFDKAGAKIKEAVYFSIGGGFIINEAEISEQKKEAAAEQKELVFPYAFNSAAELIKYAEKNNCSIADIMMANEKCWRSEKEIEEGILKIASVMRNCIIRGCESTETYLPGGLKVNRRAPEIYKKLIAQGKPHPKHPEVLNWINIFALAVNEENAAGGRVVTAPTNGAAGIIPAVMRYYELFCDGVSDEKIIEYLLTAAAIGILYKKNASISGAEMGCQGEVGVACSMAAGGLAAVLGGSIHQVENAAEIGMEHNLGLTCDPVGGLVQIPCIERNAMGSVKAVNAAGLALVGDGQHKVSLDMVIDTMREIGHNMNSIYKETSKGGLAVAVNITEC